jgi:head-tail adaptor
MTFDAAAFRDRVTIQIRTSTAGVMGRTVTSDWATSDTRWGIVVPISQTNRAALAQRGHSEVTHKLVVRGELTVALADTRFLVRGLIFRPAEAPDVDGQGRFTSILVAQEAQRSA